MKGDYGAGESLSVAGLEIGAATTKAVILDNNDILSFHIMPTSFSVTEATRIVIIKALEKTGISMKHLEYVISTGYGRRSVSFANKAVTEIICHAAGVSSLMPKSRTIIDIGGQDSKVIGLDGNGNVINFAMNDKCAAGTGRFLEVIAEVLEADIEEISPFSLLSNNP